MSTSAFFFALVVLSAERLVRIRRPLFVWRKHLLAYSTYRDLPGCFVSLNPGGRVIVLGIVRRCFLLIS
jgi:hypothetical protein